MALFGGLIGGVWIGSGASAVHFGTVISKGVLHHTPDAHKAFLEVAQRARPGGYVIVGLYNSYGRIPKANDVSGGPSEDFKGNESTMGEV